MHRRNTASGFDAQRATVTGFRGAIYVAEEFVVRKVRPTEPDWKGDYMRRIALALLSTTLLGGMAAAADLGVRGPAYKAAPPPAPYFSWTGCYIGGHVGGLWATKDWTATVNDPIAGFRGRAFGSHDADSGLGGVQAGCDYQFAGGFVVGVQGDYAWTDASGSSADLLNLGLTDRSRVRSLSSVTGRVGYAWDRFLGYVKGGGAWERDNYEMLTAAGLVVASASETRGGWTLGVGGEYAFTPWLSGFAEYNYYDFGTRENRLLTAGGALFDAVDV